MSEPSSAESILDQFGKVPKVDIALRSLDRITAVELFSECCPGRADSATRIVEHLEVHSNARPDPATASCGALLHYRFGDIPIYYAASSAPGDLAQFVFFQWLWNTLTEQSRAAVALASVCNQSGRLARILYRCPSGHVTVLDLAAKLSEAEFAAQLRRQCPMCGADTIICASNAR